MIFRGQLTNIVLYCGCLTPHSSGLDSHKEAGLNAGRNTPPPPHPIPINAAEFLDGLNKHVIVSAS